MGLLDIFKKINKIEKTNKNFFFDSIEEMENCTECNKKFSYPNYPEEKLEFYNLIINGALVCFNAKFYVCINQINQNSTEEILNNDKISIITDGIPIYLRITEESITNEKSYYTFYGFNIEI